MKTTNFLKKLAVETDEKHKADLALTIKIAKAVKKSNGRALVVGGYARDEVMKNLGQNYKSKDIDLEIFGIDPVNLEKLLGILGKVNKIGESFCVFKVGRIDIALPRRDSKITGGHRGFEVRSDPNLNLAQSARRRDFTINTIALDPLSGEIFDECGGILDIKNKLLRAVDPTTFSDDPLRVLRAMQFAGRFGFKIEEKTLRLCQEIDLRELSWERIAEEWQKMLLKSAKPSLGLRAARQLLILDKLFPEIKALIDTPQNPKYHPEGDVWTHTLLVVDNVAAEVGENPVILWAALCHDLGKPPTTKVTAKKITSYGHSEVGAKITQELLKKLKLSRTAIDRISALVLNHLLPIMNPDIGETGVRRLAKKLQPASIQELVWLVRADYHGTGQSDEPPLLKILLQKAERLKVKDSAPKALVMGRHLIELGMAPGPHFKKIIDRLFEAQIEGKFATTAEGIEYFRLHQNDF